MDVFWDKRDLIWLDESELLAVITRENEDRCPENRN
jgi:hypothetical protein